jgi:hypothetical protein
MLGCRGFESLRHTSLFISEKDVSSSSPHNSDEPRGLFCILASTLAFLLGWSLSKRGAPPLHESNQPQGTTHAQSKAGQSMSVMPIRVVIDSVPPTNPPTDEEKAKKKADQTARRLHNRLQTAATLISLGLPVTSVLLWIVTKKSADTASRQLEMIDRPWIKVGVRSWVDLTFPSGNISWGAVVRTENTGHSVANAIYPRAKLIVFSASTYSLDEPRRQAEKFCADVAHTFESVKNNPGVWGDSVLPGDYLEFPENLVAPPSDVNGASFDGGSSLGKSIIPVLIGCVEYHYPSSDKPHRTQFVYGLSHIDDPVVPEAGRVFFSIGKTIPKDKMQLFEQSVFAD